MKDLSLADLLDVYGDLLSERQKRIAGDYFYDDLSLSEISENEGISRQGAHEIIKRSEQLLNFYEEKLHYSRTVYELKKAAEKNDYQTIKKIIENL
ncbi:MAG: DNA-binding protein [Acutalibacteraceae bacterium]|nr:DNA-binding protein [Acutalibacteraceae bacterium]